MHSDSVKLSVLIPVYNERYLVRELLQRVLAVKVPGVSGLEVVIVDAGPKDGAREILREIPAGEGRIRYIEQANATRGRGRPCGQRSVPRPALLCRSR